MSNDEIGSAYLKTVANGTTKSEAGSVYLKAVGPSPANSEATAIYLKTAAYGSNVITSNVNAVYLKVLVQNPQPYKDGGNALKYPKARLTNKYTVSN